MGKAPRKTPVKKPKAKKPRGLASFMRPTKTNLAKTTKQTNDAPGKTKINTKPITHPKAWNSNKDIRNRIRITSNESQKKVNKTQSIFYFHRLQNGQDYKKTFMPEIDLNLIKE